jgi:hypothetical protein
MKFIAMHHCKKFFVASQDLFAAMQQKDQKPHFLIRNRGLWKQLIGLEALI